MTGKNEVELKGGMYTFMSLKLKTTDLDVIDQRLADKVQQAPGFFKDTPVVVDFSDLEDNSDDKIDTAKLLACIRKHKLVPIVASLINKSSPIAASIELPLIEGTARRQNTAETDKADGEKSTSKASADIDLTDALKPGAVDVVVKVPKLVSRPVRSGQQIYARDTDLIVMGQVGPGAEVIADCNIHVYGPLRGKALCGVSGNSTTRIFCQSLEAELVSVAGNYRVLEEIPEDLRGKPAQIWLDNDRLKIEPL